MKEDKFPLFSLGWELEATRRAASPVEGLECGFDSTVHGESLEYRVSRKLVYDPVKSLRVLRSLATDKNLQVDKSCGFHVHIGLPERSRRLQDWAGWFVQLGRDVEESAFKAVPESRRTNSYCRSWKNYPQPIKGQTYRRNKSNNSLRYNWINCVEIFRPGGIRTVEVRLLGNTKRYPYLLAWISACRLMAQSSWSLLFDPSRLEKERNDLREVFGLLEQAFIGPNATAKQGSEIARLLAGRVGLGVPEGRPLSKLRAKEQGVNAPDEGTLWPGYEAGQIARQLRAVQEEGIMELRRLYPNGMREVEFAPGDTVQCIHMIPGYSLTRLRNYRVLSVGVETLEIIDDQACRTTMSKECFQRVEREASLCVG